MRIIFTISTILLIISAISLKLIFKSSSNNRITGFVMLVSLYAFYISIPVSIVSFFLWIAMDENIPFWIKFWLLK